MTITRDDREFEGKSKLGGRQWATDHFELGARARIALTFESHSTEATRLHSIKLEAQRAGH